MKTLPTVLLLILSGCATYSPSINDSPDAKIVLYTLQIDQAKRIVSATMSSHFAGREVVPLNGQTVGFSTYTRMLADTWTTTVTIAPVTAKTGTTEISALKIDIRGSGSSFLTGRIIFDGFKDRLAQELTNTGSIVRADSYSIR